jgi:RNA polymerase sigma-70 factor (ECF subfamily)
MQTGDKQTKLDLDQARHGDMDAFARVFEPHRKYIWRLAYRLAGPNDCDDVVMETFLKAWKAIPKFRGGASVKTWLTRIARNCAIDFKRRESTREKGRVTAFEPEDGEPLDAVADKSLPAPDEAAARNDLGRILDAALAELSEEHRLAVMLREIDGMSYREVATATGSSMGTVMSRLFYAKKKLKQILGDKLDETENLQPKTA